ncbi:MAG: hypothetical protein EO766_12265 [Hydrotalea sp. AMD]|uniref:hypothetical protein n=1 Tax=Hydrotalea sp. AMD TaxID=2501297 RepID=UPI0010284575|nr:hypothetical protein [Hydrotalea sp. AMD]RWZ87292.1 MAG: hypothetical protein EO766_12265 [Hydrotalea sp. AMD]
MEQIITRKEAKEQGLKHFFTGKPCPRGHIDKKLVSSSTCCTCTRENHYTYYANHKETALAGIKRWSQENKENVVEASRRYRKNNPGADKRNRTRYYNKPEKRAQKLAYSKWWRSVNKDKQQNYNAVRRAMVKRAIPLWVDMDKVVSVYKESVRLTNETGIIHHVDHIIPLSHPLVCGLHVENNLQVLEGVENMSKSNMFSIDL